MKVFHIYCTISAEILGGYYVCMISLQKQIGCFNHRVVTMHDCRQAEETVV